jgi:hypothetical protein
LPQIRQGLRRLTQQKTFEVDVGMAPLPSAFSFNRFVVFGNDHMGLFLLIMRLLPLSAWDLSQNMAHV